MRFFSDLRVYRFNRLERHHEWVDRRMQTYAINLVTQGSLWWAPEGQEAQHLHAPFAFWTWPGPHWVYGARAGERGWTHRYISCTGARAARWHEQGLLPNCEPHKAWCTLTDVDDFCSSMDTLIDQLAELAPDDARITHQLEGLLLKLHYQPPAPAPRGSTAARVHELTNRLKEHPEQAWDFQQLAKELDCTPVHLRRLWKEMTGRAPTQDLHWNRLTQAATRLRESDASLQEICQAVGFQEFPYFSRLFKKFSGLPPGQYRQAYRQS